MRQRHTVSMKYRIVFLFIVMAISVVSLVGCGRNDISTGQTRVGARTFLEGQVEVVDAEAMYARGRPIRYGLAVDHEYTVRFTAEKWMAHVDGEMDMEIVLPPQLQQVAGNTTWSGNNKQMTLEVQVKALEVGETEVTGRATNLDLDKDWTFTNTIAVEIASTVGEAKHLFDAREQKYLNPEPLPIDVIREEKNANNK